MDQARTILAKHVQEPHLLTHALAVSAAMGAMAEHFGADRAYWEAVGYLHDVDYEKFPEEHLQHTHALLAPDLTTWKAWTRRIFAQFFRTGMAFAAMCGLRQIWKRAFLRWTS